MIASTYFGMGLRRIYRIRYVFYADAYDFINYLDREVRSLKTPLTLLIPLYCKEKKGEFSTVLKKYYDDLTYGYDSHEEILKKTKSMFLPQADNLLIAGFLFSLGKNDISTELTNISRYKQLFEEKKQYFEYELNKKGDMYYKLFVLLGISLMIITV